MKKLLIALLVTMLTLMFCALALPVLAESAAADPPKAIDLTAIVQAGLALLAAAITRYVVPWLKSKCTAAQLSNIAYWVQALVAAAEQIFRGQNRGAEKVAWVSQELIKRGYKLDTNEIRALIEEQVYLLKRWETEPPTDPGNPDA